MKGRTHIKSSLVIVVSFMMLFVMVSCFIPGENFRKKGVYHIVRKGETLFAISKTYHVSIKKIQGKNRLKDPSRLEVGQKLFIPGAKRVLKVAKNTHKKPRKNPKKPPKNGGKKPPKKYKGPCDPSKNRLANPLKKGVLTSKYGMRRGKKHDGIDLGAPLGTPIVASEDGVVIYEGKIGGYGKVLIIKHQGKLKTVYAHNRKNFVKQGDMVKRGQKIAEVGTTGNATGPHIHFEVRCSRKAVNPLPYIK